MLQQGKVDAITAFWFSSVMNLKAIRVPSEDIVVLMMRDYGVDLYCNVIIVNPQFAAAHKAAVAGFVRATIKGIQDTIKDPASAIKSLMKRNEIGNEAVELERLKMALDKNFVTAEVKANGLGAVDMARLTRSIDEIGIAFPFTAKPTAADIFTAEFLPPAAQRSVK